MVDQFGEPGWKGVLSAAGVGTPDWTVLDVKTKRSGMLFASSLNCFGMYHALNKLILRFG